MQHHVQCHLSVILPTYLEAQNLPVLVPRISKVFREFRINGEILVVDDSSPDPTGRVCSVLGETCPVRLLVRKGKRDLSRSVILGMKKARGSVFMVMDADLSHPPEKIPELMNALLFDEADFVLGSRHVHGGVIYEAWGGFRRLTSRIARLLAAPLTPASDPMAGFFALRRSTFWAAPALNPIGYKIALELMVRCDCRHVAEVPILFAGRHRGKSKFCFKEQLNYLIHLSRLYIYRYIIRNSSRRHPK